MKRGRWIFALMGAVAGAVNGFFGGGGGSVLVPLLRKGGLEQREAFATSVAVIFPVCALSAGIYLYRGSTDLPTALPYLLGGLAGGWLGGKLFSRVRLSWLRLLFALLLIYGGVRCLL